jgi:hypothetical protein
MLRSCSHMSLSHMCGEGGTCCATGLPVVRRNIRSAFKGKYLEQQQKYRTADKDIILHCMVVGGSKRAQNAIRGTANNSWTRQAAF